MKTKLLTSSDIEAILLRIGANTVLDRLIARLRAGFKSLDRSSAQIPVRSGIHYSNPGLGLLEWMPAMVDSDRASLKIVGYHPSNPESHGLPTILSTICVFDTRTGHLSGLLDGTFLTALRTGAMSAVATELLVPENHSGTLAIIGCGAQAVTQAHALSRVFPLERILAYDRDPATLQSFFRRIEFLDTSVEKLTRDELPRLLSEADTLCTCTSESPGHGPVFADTGNRSALHINAVGSDFPGKVEIPLSLLKRSLVVPDFREQALAEGECQQLSPEEVACDLTELLKSPALQKRGRAQTSVFDSTGHAYADYLTGLLFMEFADDMGLGADIELECVPSDPKDPYSFLSKPSLVDRGRSHPQEAQN